MRSQLLSFIAVLAVVPLGRADGNDNAGKSDPVVANVTSVTSDSANNPCEAGLGDRLVVGVDHLDTLMPKVKAAHGKIVLYLDGMPINGVYPEAFVGTDKIRYLLARSDESKQSWGALLGHPASFSRKVGVSVGMEGDAAILTSATMNLVVIRPGWFWAAVIALPILLAVLFGGARSQMIRDDGPPPLLVEDEMAPGGTPGPKTSGKRAPERPYSLAKAQMAFWFFLILFSFLFIWAVTGAHDTLTQSTLVLMGIGAGTALGVIAQNKGKEAKSDTLASLTGLQQERAAIVASGGDTKPVDAQIAVITPSSTGFLNDVLTDKDGISIHRFQLFVWTLVLGIIFIKEVYSNLAMPEFNGTLLALMGISSGTFLGFMIPEAHSTDQSPPNKPAPATPAPAAPAPGTAKP
jgi:hypothetical protein